ncbi:MAG: hypothetical protein ACI841_003422 [Planctomycetota bacterium]|jgi:hypothetical protein
MIGPTLTLCASIALAATFPYTQQSESLFAKTFLAHWEKLRDEYPYFDLYGVDWEAERAEHRPLALAAANSNEFAWELARLMLFSTTTESAMAVERPSWHCFWQLWLQPHRDCRRSSRCLALSTEALLMYCDSYRCLRSGPQY